MLCLGLLPPNMVVMPWHNFDLLTFPSVSWGATQSKELLLKNTSLKQFNLRYVNVHSFDWKLWVCVGFANWRSLPSFLLEPIFVISGFSLFKVEQVFIP